MLVRVSGGSAGIKEYLEDGRKQGRGQTRDELDERIILEGDLEATDLLIEHCTTAGEKYLHITLAFKEDHIDRETLQAITREFREFVFSAYRDDEYNFYAEAHLPRVKSYLDARTGDLVERKPHIHIVVPKTNYLSDGHLNPLGMLELTSKYLDAWQEHINDKYGLASPKDNRRIEFTSESEVISRHKGDLFDAHGKALKTRILDAVLERDIRDFDGFQGLLEEMGERRTRNAGKPNAYENLKLPEAPRGLNLKDWVFSREFLELPLQAKRERLAQDLRPAYEAAGQARATTEERLQLLQEWHDTRARELKYLKSGNNRAWREYVDAEPEQRRAILDARQARFYAKHDPENRHDLRPHTPSPDEPGHGRELPLKNGQPLPRDPGADRWSSDLAQHDPFSAPHLAHTETLDGVRSLSGLDVVRDAEDGEVLLPRDAGDHLEHRAADRDDSLRRPAPGRHGPDLSADESGLPPVRPNGRSVDSVLDQHRRDRTEQAAQDNAQPIPDWHELKVRLDAHGLLADLSRSHGVQVDKYEVLQGADGGHRIRAGTRLLNVSDFLTKELHLSWKEAEPILLKAWVRQRDQQRDQAPSRAPLAAPNPALWRAFKLDRRDRITHDRETLKQQNRLGYLKSRQAITQAYHEARRKAATLPPTGRRAALSVARMARVAAEQQLRDATRQQRARQRERLQIPMLDQYRGFLRDRAERGDPVALTELRRVAPAALPPLTDAPGWILAGDDEQAKRARAALFNPAMLRYTVERNGDVAYQVDGKAVIRDTARRVDVLTHDADVIETALRLAQQRFGQSLVLSGSTEWQEKAARTAGERGLKVTFTDQRLNLIAQERAREVVPKTFERVPGRPPGREPDPGLER